MPRGCIVLMRSILEGSLPVNDADVRTHIDRCLGCRACEPVCPSGVPYGHLLEAARVEVSKTKFARGLASERLVRFFLNQVFIRPGLLAFGFLLARWFRDSGLARLIFNPNLLGGRLQFALALLLASRSALNAVGTRGESQTAKGARALSRRSERVALLRGCVMEGLFRQTNR